MEALASEIPMRVAGRDVHEFHQHFDISRLERPHVLLV